MSFSIPGSSFTPLNVDHVDHEAHKDPKPLPTPTIGEATLQLASTGQPAAEIAANLGLPLTQVDSTLGISSTTISHSEAVDALAARLSVRV